jgi:hypothetical protein
MRENAQDQKVLVRPDDVRIIALRQRRHVARPPTARDIVVSGDPLRLGGAIVGAVACGHLLPALDETVIDGVHRVGVRHEEVLEEELVVGQLAESASECLGGCLIVVAAVLDTDAIRDVRVQLLLVRRERIGGFDGLRDLFLGVRLLRVRLLRRGVEVAAEVRELGRVVVPAARDREDDADSNEEEGDGARRSRRERPAAAVAADGLRRRRARRTQRLPAVFAVRGARLVLRPTVLAELAAGRQLVTTTR